MENLNFKKISRDGTFNKMSVVEGLKWAFELLVDDYEKNSAPRFLAVALLDTYLYADDPVLLSFVELYNEKKAITDEHLKSLFCYIIKAEHRK